jgi:hypothetical protein
MLYQLSYARALCKSTGRGGESKRGQACTRLKKKRGTYPFRTVPRASHWPPGESLRAQGVRVPVHLLVRAERHLEGCPGIL